MQGYKNFMECAEKHLAEKGAENHKVIEGNDRNGTNVNVGHSHFFFIACDDFGGEIPARAAFGKSVREWDGRTLDTSSPGHPDCTVDLIFDRPQKTAQENTLAQTSPPAPGGSEIQETPARVQLQSGRLVELPASCICVNGGPGSVDTVEAALRSGTPALLIKGSGAASGAHPGAADLISGESETDRPLP